jgi:ubiquinone/menaquinone biosynthesis C-methylase UbiE
MTHALRYDAGAGAYDRLTGRWSRMYISGVMNAAGVTAGCHVLDVATGTGDAAIFAADLVGSGGRVVAVDISGPMLREAAEKAAGRQIEFLEADAQRLPFAEGTFDAVVCLFGLMFLPDRVSALVAFRRMLRPNGAVVATCWDEPAHAPFAGLVAEALCAQLPQDRNDLLRPFSVAPRPQRLAATIFAVRSESECGSVRGRRVRRCSDRIGDTGVAIHLIL